MVTGKLDFVDLDDERVSRLGSGHNNGPGLWIQQWVSADVCKLLHPRCYLVFKRIDRVNRDRPRLNGGDWG